MWLSHEHWCGFLLLNPSAMSSLTLNFMHLYSYTFGEMYHALYFERQTRCIRVSEATNATFGSALVWDGVNGKGKSGCYKLVGVALKNEVEPRRYDVRIIMQWLWFDRCMLAGIVRSYLPLCLSLYRFFCLSSFLVFLSLSLSLFPFTFPSFCRYTFFFTVTRPGRKVAHSNLSQTLQTNRITKYSRKTLNFHNYAQQSREKHNYKII